MNVEKTCLSGCYLIRQDPYVDSRGEYRKLFEKDTLLQHNLSFETTEHSIIYSRQNVFRGIHFQKGPSQAKYITIIEGEVLIVAVDLRVDSLTFGHASVFQLKGSDRVSLFIPKHFGHGYLTLSSFSIFDYSCDGKYDSSLCFSFDVFDPAFNIRLPIDKKLLIRSPKDSNAIRCGSLEKVREVLL